MLEREIMGEIAKQMEIKEVRKTELVNHMDCSRATAYARLKDPRTLTVNDLDKIASYLGLKIVVN